MALISERGNTFGDRDYQRFGQLLDYLSEVETKIRVARAAFAAEFGFDRRRPQDIKVGDRVRRGSGTWATVSLVSHRPFPEDGPPTIAIYFEGAEAAPLVVQLASDFDPVEPQRLIVEVPEVEDAF